MEGNSDKKKMFNYLKSSDIFMENMTSGRIILIRVQNLTYLKQMSGFKGTGTLYL